jgi:hypothetical protein
MLYEKPSDILPVSTTGLNSAVLTSNEVPVGAVVIMANPVLYYIENFRPP